MKKITYLLMLMIITSVMVACKDDVVSNPDSYSRLKLSMTDAPGDYDSVIINIKSVEVKTNNGTYDYQYSKSLNLLDLVNGKDTILVDQTIPTGRISQIRLILEETGNYLYKDGARFDLNTPSALQSGLKLNLQQELVQGITYTVKLDFDVAKSVVETGNGTYILKPVIRILTDAITGGIRGEVQPFGTQVAVMAVLNTDTFSTYTDLVSGKFLISGLTTGTYKILFDAEAPFRDTVLNNVAVQNGQITNIGLLDVQ
jgi:hypothetical protein